MRRLLAILRHSLALEREAAAAQPARRPEERAFLPAVLEVFETPPSPTARVLVWTVVAFFIVALAWAWFGRIDVVATAEGRAVASGHSKVVQPAETGIVTAIRVRDGQNVRESEVLIELDATIAAAERDRFRNEWGVARLEAAHLGALLPIQSDMAITEPHLRDEDFIFGCFLADTLEIFKSSPIPDYVPGRDQASLATRFFRERSELRLFGPNRDGEFFVDRMILTRQHIPERLSVLLGPSIEEALRRAGFTEVANGASWKMNAASFPTTLFSKALWVDAEALYMYIYVVLANKNLSSLSWFCGG